MVNRSDFGLVTWRGRNSILVKTVSLMLLLTFLAYDVTWAQGVTPMWQDARPSGTATPDKNQAIVNGISIPSASGKINYADSNGNKTIINIQDAHASLSAQTSIVNLLDHLVMNYDLNLIAVEGSEGYIDTSILRTFPDKEIRRKTASSLMEEGRMSAGEFYAIVSEKPVALYGIEDNKLYKKNVELFKGVMEDKALCIKNVEALESVLTDLENKVYGKELRGFVRGSDSHRNGILSFSKYWENTSTLIKTKNVDISVHKNIDRLLSAIALEKEISFEKANKERDDLIAGLSEKLSKPELEDLALKSIAFKRGDSSQTEFHNYLIGLAEKSDLDPAPYKDLIAFARYIAIYETVDILRLYSELDSIESSLRDKLYASSDERTLYDLRQKAKTLKGLFSASLNNDGAAYLLAHKNEFNSEEISSFITKSCAKYGVTVNGASDLPYIVGRLDEAIKFYNVVHERDSVMLKNTIKNMTAEKQNVAALITGGFHSQGLADLTKAKGLSYLIIMPKFEQGKERPYIAILTNKKGSYEALIKSGQYKLAVHQFFSTTDNFDRAGSMAMTMRDAFSHDLKVGDDNRAIWALNEMVEEWIRSYTEAYNLPAYRKENLAANRPTPAQFARLARNLTMHVTNHLFDGKNFEELKSNSFIVYLVNDIFAPQVEKNETPDIKTGLNFAATGDVYNALKGVVEITGTDTVTKVTDENTLRAALIDKLVYDATFNENKDVKILCQNLIVNIAERLGAVRGSVYAIYTKKAQDKTHWTVPAINIRFNAFDTSRAVFESAKENNANPIIFEIAKSEIKYTDQRPMELTTSVLAAAIKEGYYHPIYLQGDHFQIDAKKYAVDPNGAIEDVKKLIKEAVEAGFYQIDLDNSVLVDWSRPTAGEQQKDNYTITAQMTAYVRNLEKELGLDKKGIVINLGGEIGEIGKGLEKGKERNSSVEDLIAFMEGYRVMLSGLGENLKPITKLAVQTGTKHGGIRNANGEVVKAKVSFNSLAELGKVAREIYGLAGVVQHGASTLDPKCFVVFAGNEAPQGFEITEDLLSERNKAVIDENSVAEVHLATAYQDTELDHPDFPKGLLGEINSYILSLPATQESINKKGLTPDGALKENRKNAAGAFKRRLWDIPAENKDAIRNSLKKQFDTVFKNLGVVKHEEMTFSEIENAKRPYIIGGNLKMSVKTEADAVKLINATATKIYGEIKAMGIPDDKLNAITVLMAPSFVHISAADKEIKRMEAANEIPSGLIAIGSQDVSAYEPGAHTGETSIEQLKDLGVSYVILGHSEPRHDKYIRMSNEAVNAKAKRALLEGLTPIICIGETLEEREAGNAEDVLASQFTGSTKGFTPEEMKNIVIAYEPVWAIGTGKTATPEQANEAQQSVRKLIQKKFNAETAAAVKIQYGGSMNGGNVAGLISQPNIDGGLIGGSALKPDDFTKIVIESLKHYISRSSVSAKPEEPKTFGPFSSKGLPAKKTVSGRAENWVNNSGYLYPDKSSATCYSYFSDRDVKSLFNYSINALEELAKAEPALIYHVRDIFSRVDNYGVRVEFNDNIPQNSHRLNRGLKFNADFIIDLVNNYKAGRKDYAVYVLAHRLMHELGHTTEAQSTVDNIREEAVLIKYDLLLYNLLKKNGIQEKITEAFQSRAKTGTFPSGYYFNFLEAVSKLSKVGQNKAIEYYASRAPFLTIDDINKLTREINDKKMFRQSETAAGKAPGSFRLRSMNDSSVIYYPDAAYDIAGIMGVIKAYPKVNTVILIDKEYVELGMQARHTVAEKKSQREAFIQVLKENGFKVAGEKLIRMNNSYIFKTSLGNRKITIQFISGNMEWRYPLEIIKKPTIHIAKHAETTSADFYTRMIDVMKEGDILLVIDTPMPLITLDPETAGLSLLNKPTVSAELDSGWVVYQKIKKLDKRSLNYILRVDALITAEMSRKGRSDTGKTMVNLKTNLNKLLLNASSPETVKKVFDTVVRALTGTPKDKDIAIKGNINLGSTENISTSTIIEVAKLAAKQEAGSIGVPVIDELDNETLMAKKVLLRLDYNVSNEKGEIKDDTRITETLDTLTYLWSKGATIIVVSHNGRPKGKVKKELSLGPVAERLKELLKEKGYNIPVVFHEESITESGLAERLGDKIAAGAINVLENTRYFAGEEKNDENFSKGLAELADNNLYVFDAFGTAERVHSSTGGAAKYMNNVAVGFLMKKEYRYLQGALDSLHGLIIGGGPKVSEKVPVVKNVIKNIAKGGFIIVGSGPVAAFLKARYNMDIGQKPTDQDVADAREIFAIAEENGVEVILPVDFIASDRDLSKEAEKGKSWLDLQKIPEGAKIVNLTVGLLGSTGAEKPAKDLYVYDVGENTRKIFHDAIMRTPKGKAVFYNGMLGVEELKEFSGGSAAISKTLVEATDNGVITVIGGGDTTKSAKKNKIDKLVTHCSTGGGASAAFLKGEELEAMKMLKERVRELRDRASNDAAKKALSNGNTIVVCVPEVIGKDRHAITDAEKKEIISTINVINDQGNISEIVKLIFSEGIESDEESVIFVEEAARNMGAVMGIPVRSDITVDELLSELKGGFLSVISRDLFNLTNPDISALDFTRTKLMDKKELADIIAKIVKVMPAIVSENLAQLSIYNMRMKSISRQTASGLISNEVVLAATAGNNALSMRADTVGEMKLLAEEHRQKMNLARSLDKKTVPVKLEVRLTVDEKSSVNKANIGEILTLMGINDVLSAEDVILVDSSSADKALQGAYDRLTAKGYAPERIAIVDRAREGRQDVPKDCVIFAEYADDIVTASHYDAALELLALSAKPDDLQLSGLNIDNKKWFVIKPITKIDFDQLKREIEQYEKVLIAA